MSSTSILSEINIQQLINFVSIVEHQGFLAAGEALHMTQSAISKSIGRLEETLGFELFQVDIKGSRTFRTAELTEAGRYLYKFWAPALNNIESAYKHLLISENSRKKLNIAYTYTTDANTYFWPIINRLQAENSNFMVNIESAYRTDLIPSLMEDKYDLVFVPDIEYYEIDRSLLDCCYAAVGTTQVCIHRTDPLASREYLTLQDIENHPFLILVDAKSNSNQKVVTQFFHRNNITPPTALTRTDAFNVENSILNTSAGVIIDEFFRVSNPNQFCRIPLRGFYNGILCVWKKNSPKLMYIQKVLESISDQTENRKGKQPVIEEFL